MMSARAKWSLIGVFLLTLGLSGMAVAKTKLVFPVHWTDYQIKGTYDKEGKLVEKGLEQYVEEYMKLNPEIEIEIQSIPFEEYLQKLQVAHMSGISPDVFQIYALWGVTLVDSGILDAPPVAIREDVKANYTTSAVTGATINGEIWGIPTEVDNYCLVYNKELLKEAGIAAPPNTWAELVEVAPKCTKRDAEGNITQYGFAFLAGWDSAVVHPFLSLLWSNGGEFLSEDYSRCLVNSEEGRGALEAELDLFRSGATDAKGSVWEFPNGTVAMMIMAPWYETSIKEVLQEKYQDVVGVAPIPPLKKRVNCQYTWFACVGSGSKHKKEAWSFLKWFSSEVQPATNTTREGDLMAHLIGALPPRKIDLENHPETLEDLYTRAFVEELKYARSEPNVAQGAEIKTVLMNEIVKAWNAQKTAKQALNDAAKKINEILAEFY